jgi:hypothetical protein
MRCLVFALLAALLAPSDAFERLRTEWAQDLHEKRIEACAALYAPDAVFVQPDGSRVEGAAAIRELFKTITSTFDSDLAFFPNGSSSRATLPMIPAPIPKLS